MTEALPPYDDTSAFERVTRKDYWTALGWSLLSLALCSIRYWFPPERYFDEIYYPRSAVEYLLWRPQYEWTHPPLTKLLIALSILLFGGVHAPLEIGRAHV